MIRKLLDSMEPLFHKGGKLEKLYPLYEAQETFLYSPAEVARGSTHIRDSLDTKRMMTMVVVALIPCILMALYNTGYQANKIIGQAFVGTDGTVSEVLTGWRYSVMNLFGVQYTEAGDFYKNLTGFRIGLIFQLMFHGLLYFLPMYVVTMAVGGICEVIFSVIRKHEINEGFLVTGMLFPLTLPPDTPLWQCAIGIAFGVVIGKEVFGGTGKNFLNPALTARAFLYFSYAPDMTGNKVWTTVDGFSGATILGAMADAQPGSKTTDVAASLAGKANGVDVEAGGMSLWDAFWGNCHGSIGETSTFCCLLGAIVLIGTGIGSWRIMAGVMAGMVSLSTLLCLLPIETAVYGIEPWWHLVVGGFAFGTVFMATDPVSAAMTDTGKWIYGFLIGFMTVLIRCMNPGFPEGIMLAILFGNCFAPLVDYYVAESNIKRRLARNVG
jgi:Na+-transporting NADH:ubiquinone oxidoreductase subunit B